MTIRSTFYISTFYDLMTTSLLCLICKLVFVLMMIINSDVKWFRTNEAFIWLKKPWYCQGGRMRINNPSRLNLIQSGEKNEVYWQKFNVVISLNYLSFLHQWKQGLCNKSNMSAMPLHNIPLNNFLWLCGR